jgi:hypothetical protein
MEKKAQAAKAKRNSKTAATQPRKPRKASVGAFIVARAFATVAKTLPDRERAEAYLFLAKHLPAAESEQLQMASEAICDFAIAKQVASYTEGVALEMFK